MTRHLKRQHEIAVCNRLLKNVALRATFLREGNDRDEPDVIYSCHDELLGIEVATAYYDDSQAEREWSLARGKIRAPRGTVIPIWSGESPDEKIFTRIQQELEEKCSRKYTGVDRVWLCVAQQAALSGDRHIIAACLKRLVIPTEHGFDKIYFHYQAPSHEGGEWHSIELKSG
jgi:hypothetical protein